MEEMVMPTKRERAHLFELMDTSGNGDLSEREFITAVSTQWPQFNNQQALKVALRTADTSADGDGEAVIDRKEFGRLLEYLVFFNNMWSKFSEIDSVGDGDGRLSVDEFKRGCKMVGIKLTTTEAEAEFAKMDMDGGGTIEFAEFCVWSAHRRAHGLDEEHSDTLEREDSSDSQDSHENKPPTAPRTPTPPLRRANGRRVRVPELASGRMTRLPKNEQTEETVHPTHFTVWMITKQSGTANLYPHLRNLAHLFMKDSTNLVPFLSLHREWLTGDLKVYDPNVAIEPPQGAIQLSIPVEKAAKQISLFSTPVDHGLKTPAHSPKAIRSDSFTSKSHTPRSHYAAKPKYSSEAELAAQVRGNTSRGLLQRPNHQQDLSPACARAPRPSDDPHASAQAHNNQAAVTMQRCIRGFLARIAKAKLMGAVGAFRKDSVEAQRAKERRHLWQTRREIAVIDWPQELRRAAITADLPLLREALTHTSADAGVATLNSATEMGMTALHYACCSGKDEIVMELLEAGADPRLHTRRAWSSNSQSRRGSNADGGASGPGVDKSNAMRSVHLATARAEKTPGDYALQNKMFKMQKMCAQRAFDMDREDERMAMLRKKKEIEERFGAPRSSRKPKYKDFSLKDTTELQRSDRPRTSLRSPRRFAVNAQGERVALPPALTVPERHKLSLQKYMAHQQAARQAKRLPVYPQFGVASETVQKRQEFHIHVKKSRSARA